MNNTLDKLDTPRNKQHTATQHAANNKVGFDRVESLNHTKGAVIARDEDEAREAFDRTLAVAIDFESARTVTAYCWKQYWRTLKLMATIAEIDFPPKDDRPATGTLADAVVRAWEGNEETRKRIQRAHTRLLTRGLW
mgnify:CR=1 FL=1